MAHRAASRAWRRVVEGCWRRCFVTSARGQGLEGQGCSQLDLARALLQAAEHGADIINVSGGELAPGGRASAILTDAVSQCVRRGILIVAAAGNDGCSCLHVPAALPGVLAVGAMTLDGEPLESSNWGETYRFDRASRPRRKSASRRSGRGRDGRERHQLRGGRRLWRGRVAAQPGQSARITLERSSCQAFFA